MRDEESREYEREYGESRQYERVGRAESMRDGESREYERWGEQRVCEMERESRGERRV